MPVTEPDRFEDHSTKPRARDACVAFARKLRLIPAFEALAADAGCTPAHLAQEEDIILIR
jgi:hypothetical protein